MLICFLNFLSSDNQYQEVKRPRPPHFNVAKQLFTVNFVATVGAAVAAKSTPFSTTEVAR
jgi:hypothetical protein